MMPFGTVLHKVLRIGKVDVVTPGSNAVLDEAVCFGLLVALKRAHGVNYNVRLQAAELCFQGGRRNVQSHEMWIGQSGRSAGCGYHPHVRGGRRNTAQ
jgi:hypothetical protein